MNRHKETEIKEKELVKEIDFWLKEQKKELIYMFRLLKNLDFREVLNRGFSILFDEQGSVVTSTGDVIKGQKITSQLSDGKIKSEIFDIERENKNG